MSLWWNRGRVEAGVLGELSLERERALFVHLRTCTACRAHYDTLSTGMDSLGTQTRDARESARVLDRPLPSVRPEPSRRWVFAVAFAAVLALVFVLRPTDDGDITLRGGSDEASPAFSLLAYARRGDGPVRLAADLPLGTGSVSRDERVQFFVKHALAAKVKVTVIGTAPDGVTRTLAEAEVGASAEKSSAVGAPIDLSALAPGRWKIEATLVGTGSPLVVRGTLELKP